MVVGLVFTVEYDRQKWFTRTRHGQCHITRDCLIFDVHINLTQLENTEERSNVTGTGEQRKVMFRKVSVPHTNLLQY